VAGRLYVLDRVYPRLLLSRLRDKRTPPPVFRETMERIGEILAMEIMDTGSYKMVEVETPLATARCKHPLHYKDVVIVGVLRAALPLVNGMLRVYREAEVGFVGARRIEEGDTRGGREFEVEVNYVKIPPLPRGGLVIVADPMLATASTLIRVLGYLQARAEESAAKLVVASVIASQYGVERISRLFPRVDVYTVAVDPVLNEKGYIVPGLGDAGDRSYGGG